MPPDEAGESMLSGAADTIEHRPMGLAHLAGVLKALCEENRMRVLCFLMQGRRRVCHLAFWVYPRIWCRTT